LNQALTKDRHVNKLLDILACPNCHGSLVVQDSKMVCNICGRSYSIVGEIMDFRLAEPRELSDVKDWTQHWSSGKQQSFTQRFFSFYRKAVFSRTVAHYINKYFPEEGVFIEAGSGTSETSIRVDKHQGRRTLTAVDIIMPVLEHTDPIMDTKLCGDIFHLPFQDNSLDGIWNVGVMEHFTHPQIDQILVEFHRVLKPGAPLLTLWPGTYSIPQRILRLLEKIVNFRQPEKGFHFHPPEISQLNSVRQGREVFSRNKFRVTAADGGWRSLMAFVTCVGVKDK
jgi:SAM-dependent methyltransferase